MEGWIEKKVVAVVGPVELVEATVTVTSQQEDEDDIMVKEAEESLVEKNIKRKVESSIPEGRKAKKRKLDKLEGWGTRTTLLEEHEVQEVAEKDPLQKWDWKDVTGCLRIDTEIDQKSKQASIKDWTEKGRVEVALVPEGRI